MFNSYQARQSADRGTRQNGLQHAAFGHGVKRLRRVGGAQQLVHLGTDPLAADLVQRAYGGLDGRQRLGIHPGPGVAIGGMKPEKA